MAAAPMLYWTFIDWDRYDRTLMGKCWNPDTSSWGHDFVVYEGLAAYPTSQLSNGPPYFVAPPIVNCNRINGTTSDFVDNSGGIILEIRGNANFSDPSKRTCWFDPLYVDNLPYEVDDFEGAFQYIGRMEKVGNNYYVMCLSFANSPITLAVYKSSDRQTWTRKNAANEPRGSTDSNCVYDEYSGKLVYSTYKTGTTMVIRSFDTATDTWQADSAALTSPNNGFFVLNFLCVRSDGSYVDVFGVIGTFPEIQIWYATFSGGSWGTPIKVSTVDNPPLRMNNCLVDVNDAIHMFYEAFDGVGTYQYYRRLDNSNSLNTEYLFPQFKDRFRDGCGLIYNGQLWLVAGLYKPAAIVHGHTLFKSDSLTPTSWDMSVITENFSAVGSNQEPTICFRDITTATVKYAYIE